jgi:hypothetical protein
MSYSSRPYSYRPQSQGIRKLDVQKAREMRDLRAEGFSLLALSKMFDVSYTIVKRVVKWETYRDA